MRTEQTKTPLTKGMYGGVFTSITSRFDLYTGQKHDESFICRAGWYNKSGEKLGWGDLNVAEFKRIQDGLEDGEFFIILQEQDSFWDFIGPMVRLDSLYRPKAIDAPGLNYIVNRALYVISKDKTIFQGLNFPDRPCERLSEKELKNLIA